jgi:DNA-binding transcriptional LysR family regulator
MHQIDLNLIRVFVAIYETQSATAAAERLNLTQPTVSYGLAKLREALSDQLFVRDQRNFKPTPRAVALYLKFRDALESIGNAIEDTQRFDPRTASRSFSLAMTDIGSMYFLPVLETELCRGKSQIGIELRQVSVADVVDQLASAKLDAAIGNLPSLHGHTRSMLLFHEHYVCLVGKDYATSIQNMTMENFLASRHVAVSSPYSGHQLAEDALADLGISRKIIIQTPYYTALPQLISQSDLVVLLPSRIANIFSTQSAVVAIPAPMELPDFEVKMHWHARHEANPAIKWLVDRVAAVSTRL